MTIKVFFFFLFTNRPAVYMLFSMYLLQIVLTILYSCPFYTKLLIVMQKSFMPVIAGGARFTHHLVPPLEKECSPCLVQFIFPAFGAPR